MENFTLTTNLFDLPPNVIKKGYISVLRFPESLYHVVVAQLTKGKTLEEHYFQGLFLVAGEGFEPTTFGL